MTLKIQIDLSDEEGKIVEIYRLEHNKKSNEEAAKEIIKNYKPLKFSKEKSKSNWLRSL